MPKSFHEDLVADLTRLYETKERYDIIINVGEEPNVEKIYAHSALLCIRSPYFHTALSNKWAKEEDGYLVLSKPNIRAFIFKIVLEFLYCGTADLESLEIEIIFELLLAADELLIQKFTAYIQEFLTENSYKFLEQSLMKVLCFIVHNKFDELNDAYVETICENPDLLFDSEEFLSLEGEALKLILKCDNLDKEESVIWKQLVKWGLAQCKTLKNSMMCDDTKNDGSDRLEDKTLENSMMCDNTKNEGSDRLEDKTLENSMMCGDTKNEDSDRLEDKMLENSMMCGDAKNEDSDRLEEVLQELIKLIRFYQIDPKEFIPEVWKYKHLLPDKIVEDILHCHLDPDTKPKYNKFPIRWGNFKVDSMLIDKEIALLLTNWIDKKTIDDEESKGFQYHFNLLFRNSLDGCCHSYSKFHQKCDNKGKTIVIAKVTDDSDGNWVYGGYNPLDWNGNDVWKPTTESFLFILNKDDLRGGIISYVNDSSHAIYCNSDCGPSFGEGPDFRISNDGSNVTYGVKSYHNELILDNNNITPKLEITDYEVFQVVSNISTQG
ncbi:8567_t:CDS:2 [Racocetra persica]|uniref:8567_t:CDS:1 n=1 Tax=Racocetra persica TaxID=160502 RepID=A0ACA9LZX7_9GLOM|nr:8567_t:CDS:2 [Racocetra persica]